MDNAIVNYVDHIGTFVDDEQEIQNLISFKHSIIRQRNEKELKQKWKEFLKRQEAKHGKQKH